ncbi:hypothetical protein [Streptomyces olivochromogenes]|nr:hypothetical protein [Streptomyces olivochromogenes]
MMIFCPAGSASTSSGAGGPLMLWAAVVVTTSGMSNTVAARAGATTLCFGSPTGMSRTPDSRPTWWSTSTTAAFSRVIDSSR